MLTFCVVEIMYPRPQDLPGGFYQMDGVTRPRFMFTFLGQPHSNQILCHVPRRNTYKQDRQSVNQLGECRHATISWEKSVFFQRKSVSIRILHLCIHVSGNIFTRFISRCSYAKQSRHCVVKIDSQQQRTNIGA